MPCLVEQQRQRQPLLQLAAVAVGIGNIVGIEPVVDSLVADHFESPDHFELLDYFELAVA